MNDNDHSRLAFFFCVVGILGLLALWLGAGCTGLQANVIDSGIVDQVDAGDEVQGHPYECMAPCEGTLFAANVLCICPRRPDAAAGGAECAADYGGCMRLGLTVWPCAGQDGGSACCACAPDGGAP